MFRKRAGLGPATNSMKNGERFLIDTNILVYGHDPRDQAKQELAILIVERLIAAERAVVSVQCLTEFFRTVTRRLPDPLSLAVASAQVERFTVACRVLDLTSAAVLEGCSGVVRHGLSLWDSLIWAVAKLNQVPYIITEDAPHGRFLEGVHFLNPFVPEFDLRVLGLSS